MGFQAENSVEFANITLRDLNRFKWTDLSFDYTDYPFFLRLLNAKKYVEIGNGYGDQWNLQLSHNTNARSVALGDEDQVTDVDTMTKAWLDFRHYVGAWALEEHLVDMNGGSEMIQDYAKLQREEGMGAMVEGLERIGWQEPNASDTTTPYGPLYYITAGTNTTQATGGLLTGSSAQGGTNPTGFSAVANIDSSTAANIKWRNYWDGYITISVSDLVLRMKNAIARTHFKTPIVYPNAIEESATDPRNYGIYTTTRTLIDLTTLAEQQNQNLGSDLNSMYGKVMMNRFPLQEAPGLNDNAYTSTTAATYGMGPVIGINWNTIKFKVLKGWYFKETEADAALQHTVKNFFNDITFLTKCKDRRRNWRIDKVAS